MEGEGEPAVDPGLQPPKKKGGVFYLGVLALVLIVSAGVLYSVYNYLGPGLDGDETLVSTSTGGLAGLEKWNIEGRELGDDELRTRYQELYEFAYPFLLREAVKSELIPTGVPAVYGAELGVSFDGEPNEMILVLRAFEDHPLDEGQMKRYKDVGLRISCEYCCNAKAIIFENGERACGCAHSYAMRGLAKYLIINHPDHYANDDILLELGRWKATYFPKQTISKAALKYAEIGEVDASILTEMPNMVGSC